MIKYIAYFKPYEFEAEDWDAANGYMKSMLSDTEGIECIYLEKKELQ